MRGQRHAQNPSNTINKMKPRWTAMTRSACYLTTTLHSSTYLLRRKIATSLPNHIDELVRAARKFGVRSAAMKELNRLKERCSVQWQPHKGKR